MKKCNIFSGKCTNSFHKLIYFDNPNAEQYGQTIEQVARSQAQQRRILEESDILKLQQESLGKIKEVAYRKDRSTEALAAAGLGAAYLGVPLGLKAAAVGILAKDKLKVTGKQKLEAELSKIGTEAMSLKQKVYAFAEERVGFLGKSAANHLEQLRRLKENSEMLLSELRPQIEQRKKDREKAQSLASAPWYKPKEFVKDVITRRVSRPFQEALDTYVRIPAGKDEWGIGRLEKYIEHLESLREKASTKIGDLETKWEEKLQKPDQIYSFVAEKLGREKSEVINLITNYLEHKGSYPNLVIKLIESADTDSRVKTDMKRMINNNLRGILHSESAAAQMVRQSEEGRRREKSLEGVTKNKDLGRNIKNKIKTGELGKGDKINISWDKSLDVTKRAGRESLTITNIATHANSMVCTGKNGTKYSFDLQNGYMQVQDKDDTRIGLHLLNPQLKNTGEKERILKEQREEKLRTENQDKERRDNEKEQTRKVVSFLRKEIIKDKATGNINGKILFPHWENDKYPYAGESEELTIVKAGLNKMELQNDKDRTFTIDLSSGTITTDGDGRPFPLSYMNPSFDTEIQLKKDDNTKTETTETKTEIAENEASKNQEEPQESNDEVSQESMWEKVDKNSIQVAINILNNGNLQQFKNEVKRLNTKYSQLSLDELSKEIEGKIVDIYQNQSKEECLIAIETDKGIFFDIAKKSQVAGKGEGDSWKKEENLSFSFEKEREETSE